MLRSWIDDWNYVIRNKIFKDEKLKSLMKIPEGTTIINFIDNYFIRKGSSNVLLTNQSVRIIYGFMQPDDSGNPDVSYSKLRFDIYVKDSDAHNADNDRLIYRNELIAMRLKEILQSERFGGYKFKLLTECDTATSTIGYSRYTMIFGSLKVK